MVDDQIDSKPMAADAQMNSASHVNGTSTNTQIAMNQQKLLKAVRQILVNQQNQSDSRGNRSQISN